MSAEGEWTDAVVLRYEDLLDFNEGNILPQPPEAIAEVRAWLQPTEFAGEGSEYQKHLSSRLSGTGEWVSASGTYVKWHDGDTHGMLWARGIPGSGKSVIAASLVHQLLREEMPVLYFFFRQIVDANHDANAALRDWLAQALPYSPPLQAELQEYLKKNDANTKTAGSREARKLESLSHTDLWRHLRTALRHLPRAYIVVDALDEMNQGQNTDEFLHQLTELAQWRPSQIKILTTSRPLATIERTFRLEKMLHLRLDEKKVDLDIAMYVDSRLQASSIPVEYHDAIRASVPGNANGLFLYAKLAMDAFIEEGSDVQNVLQELPANLDHMYSQLLQEHATKTGISAEVQLLIMQWVTHSTRPLRLLELADVIATTHPNEVQDLKIAKNMVRSACGALLEKRSDEAICILHHSLTEFLNGTARASSQKYPVLYAGPTHIRLATICLSYLQSGCLESIVESNPPGGRRRSAELFYPFVQRAEEQLIAPFTKYAASNWFIHARKAIAHETYPSDFDDVLDAFTTHKDFQKWARLIELRDSDTVTPLFMAVSLGLPQYLKKIISRPGTAIDEGAPICYAAEKGFVEIVQLLLDAGASPNQLDGAGYTSLHLAAKSNHSEVVSVLLKAGCDYNALTKIASDSFQRSSQHTALWYACTWGHVATVVEFLSYVQTKEDINEALSWAIESQKSDVVEKILEHPMVELKPFKRRSPLYVACSNRDLKTMKLLLAAGADPNAPEIESAWSAEPGKGLSALHALARYHDQMWGQRPSIDPDTTKQCFALLLSSGAKTDQPDYKGETPLHGTADIIAASMLLAAGANVEAMNKWNETPLHTCSDDGVIRELVHAGHADIERRNYDGLTPLLSVLKPSISTHGSIKKIFTLLDLGADASAIDKEGNGTLHYAVKLYNVEDHFEELVRRLCEAGADVNLINNKGEAPIHLTKIDVRSKHSLFHVLADAGAELRPKNDTSQAALFQWMSGSIFGAGSSVELSKIFKTLEKFGADLKCTDSKGRSLLHEACLGYGKSWEHIQFLVDHGLKPSAIDNDGNTMWHDNSTGMATQTYGGDHPRLQDFARLLELEANPRQANKQGRTPLHILSSIEPNDIHNTHQSYTSEIGAGHTGKTTGIDLMLRHYSDVDGGDRDGITPLHLASTFSEFLTRRLLDAGADPSRAAKDGSNALHISARSRAPNIVGMLIETLSTRLAEDLVKCVNSKDSTGRTPFYYASVSGSYESAQLLVHAGAEVDSVDYESSAWKACALYQQEMAYWSYSSSRCTQNADAGGVLIADHTRPKNVTVPYNHSDKIEDILTLLISQGTSAQKFIDQAILDAAELRSDRMVESLLRARALVFPDQDFPLSPLVSDSISRQQEGRDNHQKPCKNCNEVHEIPLTARLGRQGDYYLLPDLLSPEDRLTLQKESGKGTTVFHFLVSNGFASILDRMLTPDVVQKLEDREWCDVQESKQQFSRGAIEPLLLTACKRSIPNMEVILLLVEKFGVNVNAQKLCVKPKSRQQGSNDSGEDIFWDESPLHVAVQSKNWWHIAQLLPYLLDHGANTALRDEKAKTPLNAALDQTDWLNFNKEAVELLVRHGADVNSVDFDRRSCLAKALFSTNITQLLLDHGSTVTHGVFIQAINLRNVDLLRLFLSNGANPNVRGVTRYMKSADSHEIYDDEIEIRSRTRRTMMDLLIEHGANPSADYAGTTILHELIREGQVIHAIVIKPNTTLDLEARDYNGDTVLLVACHPRVGRDTSVDNAEGRSHIEVLVKRGADVRAKDNDGANALHKLRGFGSIVKDLKFLLSSAPDLVNQPDKTGNTPLHLVMKGANSYAYKVDLFLAAGGDTCLANGKGDTMLHLLLRGKWELDHQGTLRSTGKILNLFHHLLSSGANINALNNSGETPVFSFFRHGSVQMESHPDAEETRKWGPRLQSTVLEEPVYEVLTQAGVDWKAVNFDGQNILHVVAAGEKGFVAAGEKGFVGRAGRRFKALLDMGLDAGWEDRAQRTPVDVAAELGHDEVLELFSAKSTE
ncbi:ankyrin repeat-containing domain protein [Clohesyomyces aquaticus]|uniref:Ankyrin repeat-containing domain protein n=1 Tax=Clohesyomyces aquaticus TaxID=1231657 RepID=A0A1Y1Y8P9_9PLEO|nr:ankyrin repeat-containing domain protein [Clohesyomyces aquaticus]